MIIQQVKGYNVVLVLSAEKLLPDGKTSVFLVVAHEPEAGGESILASYNGCGYEPITLSEPKLYSGKGIDHRKKLEDLKSKFEDDGYEAELLDGDNIKKVKI